MGYQFSFLCYRSPLISPYIKRLSVVLDPCQLMKDICSIGMPRRFIFLEKPKPKAPLGKCLPWLGEDEVQSFLDTFAAPTDLSRRFASLQELSITADKAASGLTFYHQLVTTFKTPLQHATRSISGNLRSIHLSIPLESYRDGVFSCDVSFPVLEALSMTLYTIYLTTDYENILESCIVPWVNQHSRTLTAFSIWPSSRYDDYQQYFYTFEGLFRDLAHIPGLSSFTFKWFILPSSDAGLDALGRFIQAHAGTLSKLYIHIYHWRSDEYEPYQWKWCAPPTYKLNFDMFASLYTPSALFHHPLFTRAIPSCRALKHLDSRLLARSSFQTDPTPFLQWFPTLGCAEALTRLWLPKNWFHETDVIKLVSSVDLSSLKEVKISSHPLSMALFDVFARRLRCLQQLFLTISGVSARSRTPSEIVVSHLNDNPDPAVIEAMCMKVPQGVLAPHSPFLVDLQGTRYPWWTSLETLYILLEDPNAQPRPANEVPEGRLHYTMWLEKSQIRQTFPSVRSFLGRIEGTSVIGKRKSQ